jgi:hypothetical protein
MSIKTEEQAITDVIKKYKLLIMATILTPDPELPYETVLRDALEELAFELRPG